MDMWTRLRDDQIKEAMFHGYEVYALINKERRRIVDVTQFGHVQDEKGIRPRVQVDDENGPWFNNPLVKTDYDGYDW